MFKRRSTTVMASDHVNMVERPIDRAHVPEREALTLDLLEDPIEFAQNMHRVLYSASELQDMLCPPTPVQIGDAYRAALDLLTEAVEKKADHSVIAEMINRVESVTDSALNDAAEYGVAQGAVLEQLRQGLLELASLRYAGQTTSDKRNWNEVQEARDLLASHVKPQAVTETPAEADSNAA